MGNVLENSLYMQDNAKFEELTRAVIQFNSIYNGNNIIQDDIFSVLVNYARKNRECLDLLRFPTKDDDLCALTCIQKGRIFVYVNSWLPLSKQIFAAAHELYHIWCFIENKDRSVLRKGSFLSAATMDEDVKSQEDREANAFAGLLLVPSGALHEQMQIYGIDREHLGMEEMLRLMAIFAVPYKAILMRLYEDGYLDQTALMRFLSVSKITYEKSILYTPDTQRWQRRTPEILQTGSLQQLIDQNQEYELLTDTRAASDLETLHKICSRYGTNRGQHL